MFDVYTEQFIEAAVRVIRKRFQFMELLQKWAEPIHLGISRGLEKLEIRYNPSVDYVKKILLKKW